MKDEENTNDIVVKIAKLVNVDVTDSICLPSASRIRNTLFLFEILSFICWCISKRKRKREAVSEKK